MLVEVTDILLRPVSAQSKETEEKVPFSTFQALLFMLIVVLYPMLEITRIITSEKDLDILFGPV